MNEQAPSKEQFRRIDELHGRVIDARVVEMRSPTLIEIDDHGNRLGIEDALALRDWLNNALPASAHEPAAEWRPIETAPTDEGAMFWIRPLTKDEAWCNTSGEPIVIDSPPDLFVGKRGRWSSLWTATHWMPLPEGPTATKGEAP